MPKKRAEISEQKKVKNAVEKKQPISKGTLRNRRGVKKNASQSSHDIQEDQLRHSESEQPEDSDEESDSDGSEGSQDQDQDQSSSVTPVQPENYALKNMTFRQRRGTKMNALMARKKEEEEDPFWAEHKGLFGGDINGSDDEDEEDYIEDSSGKDQFDSDFGATESEHNQEEEQGKKVEELDEDQQRQKKKRSQLMKKINAYKQKPQKQKISQKGDHKGEDKPKKVRAEPKVQQQVGNRYIHQLFTQEQLLGQAAHTQYFNWLSLKKLISIEPQKKDFTKRENHIEGDKIVYRDKLKQDGEREVTYEICGVEVSNIDDLSHYWQMQ